MVAAPPSRVMNSRRRIIRLPRRRARATAAERCGRELRGLRVDNEVVLSWILYWQFGWFFTLQDAVDIASRAPVLVEPIRAIRNQPSIRHVHPVRVHSRQSVPLRQGDD